MVTIIVRYGELALKSERVRRRFERCLIDNIEAALSGIDHRLTRERGRIFVDTSSADAAVERLIRVPGIVSISPAARTGATIEAISSAAVGAARGVLKQGMSFAVRTRRTGEHKFSSRDVDVAVGSAILESIPGVSVDLSAPDREISIEVRGPSAYVFTGVVEGPGGLPLGTQGMAVALISGGMDSSVAAWLMMKRGCRVIPVHFDTQPYADEGAKKRAIDAVKVLSEWAADKKVRMYVVPYGGVLKSFVERAPKKLVCILCKRGMYRIAEMIAKREGAEGIVTGEVLGQVASQTLVNLRVLDGAVSVPVFRPLLGFDKVEVEKIARKIGAHEISIGPARGCTAAPRRPETCADLDRVLRAEEKLNVAALLRDTLKAAERITF